MYTQILPAKCPPSSASETIDDVLYRIFRQSKISVDEFLPYTILYRDNPLWLIKCEAYAVSFYTKYEFALRSYKKAYEKNKIIGNYIAKCIGQIKDEHSPKIDRLP